MSAFRIREAGDSALLAELGDGIDAGVNARAIAAARAVRDSEIAGVRDVTPAFHSVGVYFDPAATDLARLESVLRRSGEGAAAEDSGRLVEVPVGYGGELGPDLAAVAAFAGLSEAHVARLHADRIYRVFMIGFLPGFPYLGTVDERIASPRHASPRARVAAGSVGIAGLQTGIYPRESPGGWQIVGRTPLQLFDPARTPAALFAPGDRVRFVPVAVEAAACAEPPAHVPASAAGSRSSESARRVAVIRPGLLTTIQDLGRWGHQASGVPVAGPLDPFSHRLANALVGNDRYAAALEITLSGPELRLEHDACIALTGADLDPWLDGAPMPMNQAVDGRAGSVVRFAGRRWGARSYLAFDGGIAVPDVLGSRATHVLSALGGLDGRALRAGDTIALGAPRPGAARRVVPEVPRMPAARLRILPGPQDDGLPEGAMDALVRTEFAIAPQSNRMGYRLTGGRVPADARGSMISTPTFTGSIQVPPSGEPVLLMPDRQTTGGYPQIATVITADLPAAGQLAPGDRVAFEICSRREALAALIQQEGALLALE